jgi:hypothetical protein
MEFKWSVEKITVAKDNLVTRVDLIVTPLVVATQLLLVTFVS